MSGILLMSVGNSYSSAPVNTVAPVVTGTASAGQTLTTSDGTWAGSPLPTFTYQWQKATTDISGATSSTYVAQLSDVGSTLRCVVTATNVVGSASANSNNTATVAAPAIGTSVGGGFYAGQIAVGGGGVATHYLIVAPKSSGQTTATWGYSGTTTGVTSKINGPTNTTSLTASDAANFCRVTCNGGGGIGGFTDWYMPASNELEVLYYFLKPTTTSNTTSEGANINAVAPEPVNTNYSAGSPAQTSASAFQSGGSEAFPVDDDFWSSTEYSSTAAVPIIFDNGASGGAAKTGARYVRAVRRIAV